MPEKQSNSVILEVENLKAGYGEEVIISDVSFDVKETEILVILGRSGCGKSTLLKSVTRLQDPFEGSIKYRGEDITMAEEDRLNAVLRKIGISFQAGALFNSLTVFENVALPLRELTDLGEAEIRALVIMKLSLVGLTDAAFLMPSEISGGMKKRAGLARALALDPEMLFFDEPSAGLDPVTSAGVDKLILELRRLLGITIIVVTHELHSIKTIADRVLMLHEGRQVFLGNLEDALTSEIPELKSFFNP